MILVNDVYNTTLVSEMKAYIVENQCYLIYMSLVNDIYNLKLVR